MYNVIVQEVTQDDFCHYVYNSFQNLYEAEYNAQRFVAEIGGQTSSPTIEESGGVYFISNKDGRIHMTVSVEESDYA